MTATRQAQPWLFGSPPTFNYEQAELHAKGAVEQLVAGDAITARPIIEDDGRGVVLLWAACREAARALLLSDDDPAEQLDALTALLATEEPEAERERVITAILAASSGPSVAVWDALRGAAGRPTAMAWLAVQLAALATLANGGGEL